MSDHEFCSSKFHDLQLFLIGGSEQSFIVQVCIGLFIFQFTFWEWGNRHGDSPDIGTIVAPYEAKEKALLYFRMLVLKLLAITLSPINSYLSAEG